MKRFSLIFLLTMTAIIFFRSRTNKPQFIDEVFARTMENRDSMGAYHALIEDFDSQGRHRADIEYTVDTSGWVMKNATTNDTFFEWRKVGDDLYILNADSGWFWKIEHPNTSLPARVDPRDAINEVQTLVAKRTLWVTRMGSELCGKRLCWRYQLVDPSSQIVERYWFLDATDFRLIKDQFVIGNGETSITTYDYDGEKDVEMPLLVKDAPEGTDVLTLPGIVKNLLPPTIQKRV